MSEELNTVRRKNKIALCEVRSRESGGTRALVIAQLSRGSFVIPTCAAIGRGGVVFRRLPTSALLQFPL